MLTCRVEAFHPKIIVAEFILEFKIDHTLHYLSLSLLWHYVGDVKSNGKGLRIKYKKQSGFEVKANLCIYDEK